MKGFLRELLLCGLVLYITLMIYPGVRYDGTFQTLALAALALMLLNRIVKPVIKLLLLPINLITLGLFRWVAHVATIFLLTRIVGGFQVVGFYFIGWEWGGFIAPAMQITVFASYLLASILISLIASVIWWVLVE